ncbi:hypothetical protein AX16_003808 [Volvariella volvacea WC 439]|nr:hypothetical protein AX16_003808 [Volvariella volvacea WC 439]
MAGSPSSSSPPSANMPAIFNLTKSLPTRFGPRLGAFTLTRHHGHPNTNATINIQTPGLITTTSRGVVPHLSRDHYDTTKALGWVHIPFESFLDQNPPIPTLQPGQNPLYKFLGFSLDQHLLSMSLRDPSDGREMPPNGNKHVSALCLRGVRKVSPSDWNSYVASCQPDVVVALTDTPFTDPPYSQKRLTKSIERSATWLADFIAPLKPPAKGDAPSRPLVLVHMAGGTNETARRAFSTSLTETLYGKEAERIAPLTSLDEGVSGYTFDLTPLRISLEAAEQFLNSSTDTLDTDPIVQTIIRAPYLTPLLRASLASLPENKLRLVNTIRSPHEILYLVRDVGIDLFDAQWAQKAANIGIALDFQFPVPASGPLMLRNGKRDLGHNLYDTQYAHDFSSFASSFVDGDAITCPCAACSPATPSDKIQHSGVDERGPEVTKNGNSPYTKAYVHHLLHTHEMSAHSLLVMHNLTVVDAFFAGIRSILAKDSDGTLFAEEVNKFAAHYDEELEVFKEARVNWREVDLARGKGRLAREKAKQEQEANGEIAVA